jgi:hypothetical protein
MRHLNTTAEQMAAVAPNVIPSSTVQ